MEPNLKGTVIAHSPGHHLLQKIKLGPLQKVQVFLDTEHK